MSKNTNTTETILVNRLLYHKKAAIGITTNVENDPIQIAFPNGTYSLGFVVNHREEEENVQEDRQLNTIVCATPENNPADKKQINTLVILFTALMIINLVISCLLFADASNVYNIKVDHSEYILPNAFTAVPSERTFNQKVQFAFIIITLLIGQYSVFVLSPLFISVYVLSVVLNFFLGMSTIPYFVYSLRYVLDAMMIQVALEIKNKITMSFLIFE